MERERVRYQYHPYHNVVKITTKPRPDIRAGRGEFGSGGWGGGVVYVGEGGSTAHRAGDRGDATRRAPALVLAAYYIGVSGDLDRKTSGVIGGEARPVRAVPDDQ